MRHKIIFVYNAKGSIFNKLSDFAHKALSPATYNCHFCKLTYGLFSMKKEWAAFIEELPLPTDFQYIEDWPYKEIADSYPLFALSTPDGIQILAEASEINRLQSVQQLKELVLSRTAVYHDAG